MKKHISVIAAGALALALAASGCAKGSTPGNGASSTAGGSSFSNTNAQAYSALKQGGTLNYSAGEIVSQHNVFNADGNTTDGTALWLWYNPQVISFQPNGDLKPNPDYVTKVSDTVTDGNTVVTYELNPKAVYNDGTPIDVTSFQNTWKMNNGSDSKINAASTDGYNKMKSVEPGKDNYEVIVTFDGIDPWWGGLFNYLLNPECNTADCFNNSYSGDTLASAHPEWGAGPYKLTQLDGKAGTATLVPNDKWWGDPGKLDQINFVQRESTAGVNAFVNGESDVVGAGSADILKQVQSVPDTDTRQGVATSNYMLQLNATSAPLNDITVRQAIMTGIDRSQIDQVRFQGMNYTEKFPGSFLLFSFQNGYQDNFSQVIPNTDVAKAKSLLEGDGYTMGSDGYYTKGGKQLAISYTTFSDSATNKAIAQVIQTQMKAIGVNLTIVAKAGSDFSTVMSTGAWQTNLSGFASGDPYGVAYTCQIYCSTADPNYSGLNKSGTGNADLDAQIHAMEKMTTADDQIAAANKIEVEEFQQYGLMPLFNGPVIYQAKSNLANIGAAVFAAQSLPFGDFVENIGYTA